MRPTSQRTLEAIAATARSKTPNLSPTTAVEGRPSGICNDLATNEVNCLYLGSVREIKWFDVDGFRDLENCDFPAFGPMKPELSKRRYHLNDKSGTCCQTMVIAFGRKKLYKQCFIPVFNLRECAFPQRTLRRSGLME
ncbi:hypothetical protein AVEN_34730-1 [Araneus ventricosus]|uniref:Uncharacterized protein n=1 Tax=Araneus ventricosus TaxID=182803 RepID=A0A4Y2B0I3_ARAVE|nr:hypothetical protein AVEN_34730-1 [Araneus ventricosus]